MSDHKLEKQKCQSIVYQLLSLLTLERDPPRASVFVRELQQTARCDDVLNTSRLQLVRSSYAKHMGQETLERVIQYHQTEQDEDKCVQALTHYRVWTTDQLRSQLPLWTQGTHWARTIAKSAFAFVGFQT